MFAYSSYLPIFSIVTISSDYLRQRKYCYSSRKTKTKAISQVNRLHNAKRQVQLTILTMFTLKGISGHSHLYGTVKNHLPNCQL